MMLYDVGMDNTTLTKEYTLDEPRFVCEAVLDHITRHPETHQQAYWQRDDAECGTVACLAGWCGLLHNDTAEAARELGYLTEDDDGGWALRQAHRLGITGGAAQLLFNTSPNSKVVKLLTSVTKWHTTNTGLMTREEMWALIADINKEERKAIIDGRIT